MVTVGCDSVDLLAEHLTRRAKCRLKLARSAGLQSKSGRACCELALLLLGLSGSLKPERISASSGCLHAAQEDAACGGLSKALTKASRCTLSYLITAAHPLSTARS